MTLRDCGRALKLNPHQLATVFTLSTTLATITHPAKSSILDPSVASNYITATTLYTQQIQDRHDEVDIQYVLSSLRLVGAPPLTVVTEDLKQQKFVVEAEPSETVRFLDVSNGMIQGLTLHRSAKSSQRSRPKRAGNRRHRSSSTRVRFCKTTRPSNHTKSRRRVSSSAWSPRHVFHAPYRSNTAD